MFSDASTMAIATVAYIKTVENNGQCHVGFIMGKSKLAPKLAHTVPLIEMKIDLNSVKYYTDSKIVLGYINSPAGNATQTKTSLDHGNTANQTLHR